MNKKRLHILLGILCTLVLIALVSVGTAVHAESMAKNAESNELLSRYDTNHDCIISISDVTATLNHLSGTGAYAGETLLRFDSNRDGQNSISDVTAVLNFLAYNTQKIEATFHTVTYKNNRNDAAVPTKITYAEHIGIEDLPDIAKEGYKFKGWSEKVVANDAELIDDIPNGSTKNYTLYAQWELIEYKILYNDAPVHSNVSTYTVEDEVTLKDPQWSGLRFAYWTDKNGNTCEKIPAGTIGDVTLTANWRSMENIAVPYSGIRELWTDFNEQTGHQVFIYPLGEIQNVVLERLDKKYKYAGSTTSWSETTTVTFEEEVATEISKEVSNSVSQTAEYIKSHEEAISHSDSYELGFKVGGSYAFIKDILSINAESNLNFSITDERSASDITTNSKGESASYGETLSNSSSITYNHTVSKSFNTSYTVESTMPEGTYRYVYYGTVHVFAVVTYEPLSGNYRMDTYSILDSDIGSTVIYTPPTNASVNILPSNGLPYDFSWSELENYLEDSYYVRYDANEGTGTMPISAHRKDVAHTLCDNLFSRQKYLWLAWELEDGTLVYKDQLISNVANAGDLIVAKAYWLLKEHSVTFDAAGGSVSPDNKAVVHEDVYGTLPVPTKDGYTFDGWYLESSKITSSTTVTIDDDHTLVAKWKENSYTVLYNANGGSGSTAFSSHIYDTASHLTSNTFTRTGWIFRGWSTNPNATKPTYTDGQSVINLTAEPNGNVILYAVWELKLSDTTAPIDPFTVTDSHAQIIIIDLNNAFDIEAFHQSNITLMTITYSFHIHELDDGYQSIYFSGDKPSYNNTLSFTKLYHSEKNIDAGGSKIADEDHSGSFNIRIDELASNMLYVTFDAHGKNSDDWVCSNVRIQLRFS